MDKIYSRNRIRIPKIKGPQINNKKFKKIYFMIIMYSIAIFTSVFIFKSIDPIFEGLCKAKAMSIATDITNRKSSEILAKYDYKKTVSTEKTDNGKNNMLKTDVVLLNEIVSDIAKSIQEEIDNLSEQYIEIPIGTLTGNKYITGFGPKVKIKIISAGDIETNIKTEFKSEGINQTVYRIFMELKCNVAILMPYKTVDYTIENQVLLVETVIVGGVPETYLNLENK